MGLGQTKDALKALETSGNPPDGELQARRLMHQGQAWFRLADFLLAEKMFKQARDLAEAEGAPMLVAEIEVRRGALLGKTQRFEEADATLRHVLDVATRGEDPYLQAQAMGNLGLLFLDRFRLDEAIYWFQRAYDVFIGLGASTNAAKTIGNLGQCSYQLGDSEKALKYFTDATDGLTKAGDMRGAQIWIGDSGNVYWDAKDLPAAIDRYKRALTIARDRVDRPYTAKWLNDLAHTSIESGQLDAAEGYNNEALKINGELDDKTETLHNHVTSARIAVGRRQFALAEKLFQSVLSSGSEDPTTALDAREGLADLYVQMGQADKADAMFRSAIAVIERRQEELTKEDHKLTYFSSLVSFYRSYVDFLVERRDTNRALEVVESSRARILKERVRAQAAGLKASDLQALARSSNRILLSYWVAPKRSYVWVITPATTKLVYLRPEKEIRELVENYRTAIEGLRDPIESGSSAGERLSEVLLEPIRDLVPTGSRVTIAPDGALHSLNFETLPVGKPPKYWIEDVTLSVAPSLGLLLNSRAAARPQTSLLAMGDPKPAGPEYPRLPNARKEVEAIAAWFPANNKVYQDEASNPAAYSEAHPERYSLIHFAAHATANRSSPLDSALILSRKGAGYTLTAREIKEIPLNADVVTLSACRSAGARAYSGEGLVGLASAFLEAGARRVIAGLWDVNDASTSLLMAGLYGDLARGRPPEEALRTAKRGMLHGRYPYRKPYYWGPFQLYTGVGR